MKTLAIALGLVGCGGSETPDGLEQGALSASIIVPNDDGGPGGAVLTTDPETRLALEDEGWSFEQGCAIEDGEPLARVVVHSPERTTTFELGAHPCTIHFESPRALLDVACADLEDELAVAHGRTDEPLMPVVTGSSFTLGDRMGLYTGGVAMWVTGTDCEVR